MRRPLRVSDEVAIALRNSEPIVALESTIISHGMPFPQNVECARNVESAVEASGARAATIAIVDGDLVVGLTPDEMDKLADTSAIKASRRDLAAAVASKLTGGTTVAATMMIAHLAGIRIFATGGIGGVHRGYENTLDVSADLEELAQTPVAVVCAGIKSVLDLPRTLEYLETKGVAVLGFRIDNLPAFYARDSGLPLDYRVETAADIAAMLIAHDSIGLNNGTLIANPIPAAHALPRETMDRLINTAIKEMEAAAITGKDATPFLLQRITELSAGDSLAANMALVVNNARLAAEIAVSYATSG
ncbi:MAG: pseudouridine-5'-phosphate glycosidase [Woeseiaceae bacterium]|nr:pseudouridine-5'-phosphate glycosidase [Woeseiaceae bacterium]